METKNITFEAQGGKPDSNSWNYKLIIKHNSEFILNFHLRSWQGDSNWSDASVDDWVYSGKFTVALDNGMYALTFSDIYKSGKSQANGDWSGPKPIVAQPYMNKMSALIKVDGTCDFKKDAWGVYMKGGSKVKEFFKTYYQFEMVDLVLPNILNGNFCGDTTTQEHKDYDDWYVRCDKFDLNPNGTYVHFYSSANHDYDSGWTSKKTGKYLIRGKKIFLDNDTLNMVWENGKLSHANWGAFNLKWTPN